MAGYFSSNQIISRIDIIPVTRQMVSVLLMTWFFIGLLLPAAHRMLLCKDL